MPISLDNAIDHDSTADFGHVHFDGASTYLNITAAADDGKCETVSTAATRRAGGKVNLREIPQHAILVSATITVYLQDTSDQAVNIYLMDDGNNFGGTAETFWAAMDDTPAAALLGEMNWGSSGATYALTTANLVLLQTRILLRNTLDSFGFRLKTEDGDKLVSLDKDGTPAGYKLDVSYTLPRGAGRVNAFKQICTQNIANRRLRNP